MKKLLLGMGLTWLLCNFAILYGIGWGIMNVINSESLGAVILKLAGGMVMLMLIILLSMLSLGLVAMMFGDKKTEEKVVSWLPEIMK
jgi:hypothetical protein